jgi:hypothetical protein
MRWVAGVYDKNKPLDELIVEFAKNNSIRTGTNVELVFYAIDDFLEVVNKKLIH